MLESKSSKRNLHSLATVFCRFFTSDSQFHTAVREGDFKTVKKTLSKGINVNHVYAGCPWLFSSLMNGRYDITLLLLERRADPNISYRFYSDPTNHKKLIDSTVTIKNISDAKLLVWYGAIFTEENFNKISSDSNFKNLLSAVAKNAEKRRTLEENLKNANNTTGVEICQELSKLWKQQAENETNGIYQQHYLSKAEHYQKQAEKLAQASSEEVELTVLRVQ